MSEIWDELLSLSGTKLQFTTAYHSQTDGPVRSDEPCVGTIPKGLCMISQNVGSPPSLGRTSPQLQCKPEHWDVLISGSLWPGATELV